MNDHIISRILSDTVQMHLKDFPVVAILGPRQSGKSTLVKKLLPINNILYLDLERPSDVNKLTDPELFFSTQKDKIICLDEIQRMPNIFEIMRSFIDENERNGQFLILGSASPDLLKQSAETLAGRIVYKELTPFLLYELQSFFAEDQLNKYWLRGGFPRSFLATTDIASFEWRISFIRTFLERDIPVLGYKITSTNINRLLVMLAHSQGQVVNYSKLGSSLGISYHTIQNYIDLLSQTYIVRILQPFEINTKKRIVKSPKVYLRDTGLLHALLNIESQTDLFSHPAFGPSWEGMAIENCIAMFPGWGASFYRTSSGAEIDLILQKGDKKIAFEFKANKAPKLTEGFWNAFNEVKPGKTFVVSPVDEPYTIKENVIVCNIKHLSSI